MTYASFKFLHLLGTVLLLGNFTVTSVWPCAAVPKAYWKLSRQWLFWGIVSTVPLVAALYVMVSKRA